MRIKRWKVRVKRLIEDWVEVQGDTLEIAEHLAAHVPGVHIVIPGYTLNADRPVLGDRLPSTVEDPDD